MYYCPKCGKPVTETSAFCPNCGKKLKRNNTSKSSGSGFFGSLKKQDIFMLLLICALLAGCIWVGSQLFIGAKNKQEEKQNSKQNNKQLEEQLSEADRQLANNEYQQAVDTYERVSQTNPDSKEAHLGLARTYAKMADQTEDEEESANLRRKAVASYEKVLDIDVYDVQVRNEIIVQYNIILIYAKKHEDTEMIREIEEKIEVVNNIENNTDSDEAKESNNQQNSDQQNSDAAVTVGKDKEVQEAEDSVKVTETDKVEARALFEEYYRDSIIPGGTVIDQQRKETVLSSGSFSAADEEWCLREGLIGMDLADLDSDGQIEMIVYHMDIGSYTSYDGPFRASSIYADIYRVNETKEVERAVSAGLSDNLPGSNTCIEKIGIAEFNEKEYLFRYEYLNGIFANGVAGYYTLYTLDDGQFRKAYVLGQRDLGSANLFFAVDTYTGEEAYETICCARDESENNNPFGDYTLIDDYLIFNYGNRYECDVLCWKQLGVTDSVSKDSISEGADYWNSELVRGGFSLVITSSDIDYNDSQTAYMYSELENRTEYPASTKAEVKQEKKNESEKQTDSESPVTYDEVIEQYREVLKSDLSEDTVTAFQEKYSMLNYNLIQDAKLNDQGLCYCTLDVNHDGVDELLINYAIAQDTDENGSEIFYSLYTQKDGRVIPLDTECAYRIYLYFCEDGTIVKYGSGGALYAVATIYKISDSRDALTLITEYEGDWEKNSDEPFSNGEERLSWEEFNEKYAGVKLSGENWMPI